MGPWHWLALRCAQAWTLVLFHLVEFTLVCAAVGLASVALGRAPARIRHALWLVALVKLLVPTVVLGLMGLLPPSGAPLGGLDRGDTAPSAPISGAFGSMSTLLGDRPGGPEVARRPPAVLFPCLTVVWLVGMAVYGRRLGASYFLARDRIARARPAGARVARVLGRASKDFGSPRSVSVLLSTEVREPSVAGFVAPTVLLPEELVPRLTDGELQAALGHELVHVRRGDQWTALLQGLADLLFWFFPLTSVVGRRLMVERELACDEDVLRSSRREDYVAALWKVVRFDLGGTPSSVSLLGGSSFRRRLEIMQENRGSRPVTWQRLTLGATILGVSTASLAIAGLARPSTVAEEPQPTVAVSTTVSTKALLRSSGRGGKVTAPKKTHDVQPIFPPLAQASRVQGDVVLNVTIDMNGSVRISTIPTGHPLLTPAAIDAVTQWRYEPSLKDGKPIPVPMSVVVAFRLPKRRP